MNTTTPQLILDTIPVVAASSPTAAARLRELYVALNNFETSFNALEARIITLNNQGITDFKTDSEVVNHNQGSRDNANAVLDTLKVLAGFRGAVKVGSLILGEVAITSGKVHAVAASEGLSAVFSNVFARYTLEYYLE